MRSILTAALAVILMAGWAVAGEKASEVAKPVTVVKKDAEAEGLISIYQGNTFYFCVSSCKRYFDRNPGKYLKRRE